MSKNKWWRKKARWAFCGLAVLQWSGGFLVSYGADVRTGNGHEFYDQIRITEEDHISSDVSYMLQDKEHPKILFDKKERSFRVNRPLQVNVDKKGRLLLRFYSPRPIRDVVVWARLPGMRESFRLAEFKIVRAFAEIRKSLPVPKQGKSFFTRSGQVVHLKVNQKDFFAKLELEIECSDPL